jgi:hypothetical protein
MRIRQEVLEADWEDDNAIIDSLEAKILAMRAREEEAAKLLEAISPSDTIEDGDEDGGGAGDYGGDGRHR